MVFDFSFGLHMMEGVYKGFTTLLCDVVRV